MARKIIRSAVTQAAKEFELELQDKVKKKKTVKEIYDELRPKTEKIEAKPQSFSDKFEEELKKSLFEQKIETVEEVEETVNMDIYHKKDGKWDVDIDEEIKYFDPTLSYELTGYRPIDEHNSLDFDPTPFMEVARIYNETGSYTEYPAGSKLYNDFWSEQYKRCREGYTVGDYRITGDHYFFLNFYRMETINEGTRGGGGRTQRFPSFLAKQYEFFHYVEMAELNKKDVCILKARGLGLSEIVACLGVRPYITNRGYRSLLTCADSTKLEPLKNKCWLQLNWLDMNTNGGMRHLRQKKNNADTKRASQVTADGVEYGWMSEIDSVVADTSDKIRGQRVDRLIYEECFGKGTKVIMSDYSIKSIEEIVVGDFVLGLDGTPQEVVRTTSGTDELFLVNQKCGVDYIVNSKHKLYLERRHSYKGNYDGITILTPIEYLQQSEKARKTLYGVSTSSVFGYDDCEMDPYYFGLWLGDGYSKHPNRIIINDDDVEIKEYVCSYFDSIIGGSTEHIEDSCGKCQIYYKKMPKGKNFIINQFIKYNLFKNKHIPTEVYKSSIQYRLQVLAGLIDTDGFIKSKGSTGQSYEIAMSKKDLILDIKKLAESCGFKCTFSQRTRLYKDPSRNSTIEYSVAIKGNVGKIPVKIPRKKVESLRCTATHSTKVSVTPIGRGEYYGITLKSYDRPDIDHLFFLEDFTVVHNCGSNKNLVKSWIQGNALVELGGDHFGSRIGLGTGGDDMALEGLSTIFQNPEAYNVLPYKNYDTEDGKPQLTAFFLPAHKFSLKSDYLDSRGVTDSERFKEYYISQRQKLIGKALLDYCAEHCFIPNEALYKQGANIFDSIAIADRLTQIRVLKQGLKPRYVSLLWDRSEGDTSMNKVKIVDNSQSKIRIYEEPLVDENREVYKNLYIAGIDSIDQGTADSATQTDVSDFCIVIKKRMHGLKEPKYVAIYKDRPRDIREAYDIALKLLTLYNCKALLEHTKISIITYFKEKKKDHLFMKRPASTMGDMRRGNSQMIGTPATENVIKHGLELINNYVNDYVYSLDIDDMLEQLLKYSYEEKRKFDIIAAMSMSEIADEELMDIVPSQKNSVDNEWQDLGWYRNEKGYKVYGVIPTTYGYRR